MHHARPAVHNDPFTVAFAFHPGLGKARLAHGIAHAGCESLGLAVGRAAGNDHALKQRREVFGVKNSDVLGFHVLQPINDGALEFGGVFFSGGFRH